MLSVHGNSENAIAGNPRRQSLASKIPIWQNPVSFVKLNQRISSRSPGNWRCSTPRAPSTKTHADFAPDRRCSFEIPFLPRGDWRLHDVRVLPRKLCLEHCRKHCFGQRRSYGRNRRGLPSCPGSIYLRGRRKGPHSCRLVDCSGRARQRAGGGRAFPGKTDQRRRQVPARLSLLRERGAHVRRPHRGARRSLPKGSRQLSQFHGVHGRLRARGVSFRRHESCRALCEGRQCLAGASGSLRGGVRRIRYSEGDHLHHRNAGGAQPARHFDADRRSSGRR